MQANNLSMIEQQQQQQTSSFYSNQYQGILGKEIAKKVGVTSLYQ